LQVWATGTWPVACCFKEKEGFLRKQVQSVRIWVVIVRITLHSIP
jgi:hypothetical protein